MRIPIETVKAFQDQLNQEQASWMKKMAFLAYGAPAPLLWAVFGVDSMAPLLAVSMLILTAPFMASIVTRWVANECPMVDVIMEFKKKRWKQQSSVSWRIEENRVTPLSVPGTEKFLKSLHENGWLDRPEVKLMRQEKAFLGYWSQAHANEVAQWELEKSNETIVALENGLALEEGLLEPSEIQNQSSILMPVKPNVAVRG